MITLHDYGGALGWPLDTFFRLSQFHGHNSWLVCEATMRSCASKPSERIVAYNYVHKGFWDNRPKLQCFQVQPVTCCDISDFLLLIIKNIP